ncbi:unnamed protein product [Peronospora belbahrii]|uniref:FLZ-type domain-containing protein n=1 Tax=Peronospora belbahrii TaxID=622444 RepID=A0AAU9KTE3_9STRA|nr:unnamed protein product [Peronospora belbahrii]CAH0518387.1 unnamed protein product [Peronospora belbahrii]
MDAFFQKIASSLLFTSAKSVSSTKTKQPKPVLLASGTPRSHSVHQRTSSTDKSRDIPRRRIAHWDKKREKCANCDHIYLKTLSQHPGFCSVDCKSNMVYLDKINRTIHAMKDAVQKQRRQKEDQNKVEEHEHPTSHEDDDDEVEDMETKCKTFAEFGLESRILDASKVEWAFSAMY